MKVIFAAGHVLGEKIWMGYNEDQSMMDLARRKARYATTAYGVESMTFYVTHTSYLEVEEACRGYDIASFEHSNAEAAPVKGTANRVTVYRTVRNPGDGPCLLIAQVTAQILNTVAYPVAHSTNSRGGDAYGVLGRAMQAGCKDAYLIEHGFHTHPATRLLLSDPDVRQRIAEAEVDAMASYYGWTKIEGDDMIKYLEKSENVKLWQSALIDAGFDVGSYGADGSFGPDTKRATNAFKDAVGLPEDEPPTVTLVEWYALQAYQKGQFTDDGITHEDLDIEKAKTAEALAHISILQDKVDGLQVQVDSKQEDLFRLKQIETEKQAILSRI
jgi:hypothetical protein